MRFGFSEEQKLAARSVRELLERECSVERVRECWTRSSGRVPGLWDKLAELGITGLLVSGEHGGLGANELDLVLLLEEAGRAALPEPLAETAAVAAPLLSELPNKSFADSWLDRIVRGNAIVSVAIEPWPYITHADIADLVLIEQQGALVAVERGRAELSAQPSVDGARKLFKLQLGKDSGIAISCPPRALDAARDRAALAASAELVGLGARMLELSVEYAQTRHQFGRAIGSFQAVQHKLADALLALELARPLVYRAAYSLATHSELCSLHVSMAKSAASEAATSVSRTALQVHGAIGYSFEHSLHFFMKRAWALAAAWGSAAWHRERCAAHVLGPLQETH